MLDQKLINMLRCPCGGGKLKLADRSMIESGSMKPSAGGRSGIAQDQRITQPMDEGLLNARRRAACIRCVAAFPTLVERAKPSACRRRAVRYMPSRFPSLSARGSLHHRASAFTNRVSPAGCWSTKNHRRPAGFHNPLLANNRPRHRNAGRR